MKRPTLSPLRPLLKAMLNPTARKTLRKLMGDAEGRHILDRTWDLYPTYLRAVDNDVDGVDAP